MTYNSYHMHTTFCDGSNTPEEMAEAALRAGCSEIGFSGHSWLDFDPDWTMDPAAADRYRSCIRDLAARYEGKLHILCGVEQDYCSTTEELSLYDYVIGGVHCVFKDGHYISVDADAKGLRQGIEAYYGGDASAFAEDYFEMVGDLYEKTRCQVIAHFDLLTKFQEQDPLFDLEDPRYKRAEEKALERVIECPAVVEINTGAMSRGYRTSPYPGERILEALGKARKPVILSSDAHSVEHITYGFDEAVKLVEKYDLVLKKDLI